MGHASQARVGDYLTDPGRFYGRAFRSPENGPTGDPQASGGVIRGSMWQARRRIGDHHVGVRRPASGRLRIAEPSRALRCRAAANIGAMEFLAGVSLGIGLFVATNVDDLFLLLAWFASGRPPAGVVVAGQYLGIGLIVGASVVAAVAAATIAGEWIRLFGLLPIAIGVRRLVELVRREPGVAREASPATARGLLAVSSLTVANGADNLGVYTPLFATRPPTDVLVMVGVFAVMTGLWCLAAHLLVNHRLLGAPIRRYGHLVVPFVLVGIGVSIVIGD